jgi:hypothetical protein
MSFHAVAWALEQDVPARAKLVLVSIANHADHRTGYCWLKAETIADEASCTPRGVYNFVGDLVRNGFIRKELRKGEDGKQRATDYWILFDRQPGQWLKDRPAGSDDEDEETTTSMQPDEQHSTGSEVEEVHAVPAAVPAGSYGPVEPACMRKESSEEPSESNPRKSDPPNRFAAPPRRYVAPPIAPDIQGDLHPDASKPIFVRCGTRAWDAWVKHKERERRVAWTLTTTLVIDGERRTGWHFPTLFPPSGETASGSAEEGCGVDPPAKKTA